MDREEIEARLKEINELSGRENGLFDSMQTISQKLDYLRGLLAEGLALVQKLLELESRGD